MYFGYQFEYEVHGVGIGPLFSLQNAKYQEQEMCELRQQLRDAHAITRDANQNIHQLEDSQRQLQNKADKVQRKLDSYKQEAQEQLQQVQVADPRLRRRLLVCMQGSSNSFS